MGLASHGLQDALFDTLFLPQVERRDRATQDETDPGTDAFLHTDGHAQFKPDVYVPYDTVLAVLASTHDHIADMAQIELGMNRVKGIVIDSFSVLAESFDEMYRPTMPWGSAHYMDPSVPGSLMSEIPATAAYIEAVWERLHNRFPVRSHVVYVYPTAPRRLYGLEGNNPDSWVTLVFGAGVLISSLADRVRLTDAQGQDIPIEVKPTRWLSEPSSQTRLVVIKPQVDLEPQATYTVTVRPGLALIDGQTLDVDWSHSFETPCVDKQKPGCGEQVESEEPPSVAVPSTSSMDEQAEASTPFGGVEAPQAGMMVELLTPGRKPSREGKAPSSGTGATKDDVPARQSDSSKGRLQRVDGRLLWRRRGLDSDDSLLGGRARHRSKRPRMSRREGHS